MADGLVIAAGWERIVEGDFEGLGECGVSTREVVVFGLYDGDVGIELNASEEGRGGVSQGFGGGEIAFGCEGGDDACEGGLLEETGWHVCGGCGSTREVSGGDLGGDDGVKDLFGEDVGFD